jgi:hypothetical protein
MNCGNLRETVLWWSHAPGMMRAHVRQCTLKHSQIEHGLSGQNVFFGPCASCPCMKSTSVDKEIQELGKDLEVTTPVVFVFTALR